MCQLSNDEKGVYVEGGGGWMVGDRGEIVLLFSIEADISNLFYKFWGGLGSQWVGSKTKHLISHFLVIGIESELSGCG